MTETERLRKQPAVPDLDTRIVEAEARVYATAPFAWIKKTPGGDRSTHRPATREIEQIRKDTVVLLAALQTAREALREARGYVEEPGSPGTVIETTEESADKSAALLARIDAALAPEQTKEPGAWGKPYADAMAKRITHGRHCTCSACKQEDWTNPKLAPCGMHGRSCPRVYDPWGAPGTYVAPEQTKGAA